MNGTTVCFGALRRGDKGQRGVSFPSDVLIRCSCSSLHAAPAAGLTPSGKSCLAPSAPSFPEPSFFHSVGVPPPETKSLFLRVFLTRGLQTEGVGWAWGAPKALEFM